MKKILRKLILVVLSAAVILPATANAAGDWRYFHPNQIVITENTPLYDVELPGSKLTVTPTGAALAPQVVTCTGGWNSQYYAVETWIGTKWVSSTSRIYGQSNPQSRLIYRVPETMYLFDEPFKDKKTDLAIAPQDVESIDASDVGTQPYLKIHTWVGDKWIKTSESKTPVRAVKRWGTVSHTWIDIGDPTKPDPNINLD